MGSFVSALLDNLGIYKVRKLDGKYFYTIGSSLGSDFWGERSINKYIKDFIEIPELNALVNYRAQAEARIKLEVVSKKTGKPVDNALSRLLKQPNWFQSQGEFWKQTVLNRILGGTEYIYTLRPVGFKKSYKALFTLPPQNMFIKCGVKYFFLFAERPEEIKVFFRPDMNARDVHPFDFEDLIILSENNVKYNYDKESDMVDIRKNYLYGISPIASLTPELETLRLVHEGRYSLRDMPAGVLGSDSKDMAGAVSLTKPEKKRLQKDLKQYSISRSKYQWIISNKSITANSTIVDIDKIKLYEDTREAIQKICQVIEVPFELVGKDVTYENKKEAKKQMYQDSTIPSGQERVQAMNRHFETEKETYEIIGTYEHLFIFQDDLEKRGKALTYTINALNKALGDNAITIEDYQRELIKFNIGTKNNNKNE